MHYGTKAKHCVLFPLRKACLFYLIPSAPLLVVAWGLTLLGGCADSVVRDPDAVVIAIEASPTQLDPRYSIDAYSSRIGSLLFASLTRSGVDARPLPYAASKWWQPDRKTYIFELRDDLRFHDGRRLRARDVVATYRSILDHRSSSPKRAALASLQSVEAEGATTVIFRLSKPDAAFMHSTGIGILAADGLGIEPVAALELTGSGPYRLASFDSDRLRLEAVQGSAAGDPTIETLIFKVLPDSVMRALELRHGSVDIVQNAIDPDTVDWLDREEKGVEVRLGDYNAYQYIGVNLRHPALAKLPVRRALVYAIDRNAIVRYILKGQAQTADAMLPPHHWAYSDKVRHYSYDPDRARRLLERAGYTDPPGPAPRLTLSYKTTTIELRRRIAEVLAAQLSEVGIELKIESYEWGTFFADVRAGNFDLYSLAWVGIEDPDLMRTVFHSRMQPPDGNNRGGYSDAITDRLSERALRSRPGKRRKLYARLQRRNSRRLPYIPLWWPRNVTVISRRLTGFEPLPSGQLWGILSARLRR